MAGGRRAFGGALTVAFCAGCQGLVKKSLNASCSACRRPVTLCRRCYGDLNDDATGQAKSGYHCSKYLTGLPSSPSVARCKRGAAMRWNLPGEDPEALLRRSDQERQELERIQKAIQERREASSSLGIGCASLCASAKERLTISRQVEHLQGWKKRPCTCAKEHAAILERGWGTLSTGLDDLPLEKRKRLYAGLSTYAMRRIMQIHKICTPTGQSELALKLRGIRSIYLNGTICVTVLEKGKNVKILLTENVSQTSTNFLCALKMKDEWVHEPDPIRFSDREKRGANYYLHRMCATEPLVKPMQHSGAAASCESKHASDELGGPVAIHDRTHEHGYSLHHAEMQAVHYAFRFGWRIIAMAPSRPCCALCAGTLEGLGLMPVVRHPHEWGFGEGKGDYQKLSDWSDETYFKLPNALRSLTPKDIEWLRHALWRHDPSFVSQKREREEEASEKKAPEEDAREYEVFEMEEAPESGGQESVEERSEKRSRVVVAENDNEVRDLLVSPKPDEPSDQVDALMSELPFVEVCDRSEAKLPAEFLSFFEGFAYGAELAPEDGHAPREVLGITNTGNSCYLNSILQLLIHTDAVTGIRALLGTDQAESLGALLHLFMQTYGDEAAQGTYIEESATCFYTTGLVDDLRTVLYEARVINGMYSQEDALLALEHILQAYNQTLSVEVTKRYHLALNKQVPVFPDQGSDADDNGNVVTTDVRCLLRLGLDGRDETGASPAIPLDTVLDANWNQNHAPAFPTDTRVNNRGNVYQNVDLLQESWAWSGGVVPAHLFLALNRFFYRHGAAGKNKAKVAVPVQLPKWGRTYSLRGFIVHTGENVYSGHYVSYIVSPANPALWYRIDDRNVDGLAHDSPALADALERGSLFFYGP